MDYQNDNNLESNTLNNKEAQPVSSGTENDYTGFHLTNEAQNEQLNYPAQQNCGPESNDSTPANEVKSYTPPQEFGFMPGYGQYNEYNNNTSQYSQTSNTPPEKKKKKNKVVSITTGMVVSISLVCAIISSVCTSVFFMLGDRVGESENTDESSITETASDGTIKQINIVEADSESLVEAIAEKVSPSVVGIRTTTSVTYMFYGTTEQTGEGSGIIYTSDGYIITNYHVISDAVENEGKISVFLASDAENAIDATVVGYDVSSDLAVIKIDKTGLIPVEIGDSDEVKVGQTAVAVGNPGGLEFMGSVSAGIVSGLNRTIQVENTGEIMNLIQTDAAINPGNSGGALVNSNGLLIGINSAKLASTGYEGMGFAIPSNAVVEICQRIINNVDEPQAYLGVEISSYYTSDRLNMIGYPSGVVIEHVTEGGPADEAGLKRGDIITEFNGTAVTSYVLYNSEKAKYSPGEEITLTIYRQGRNYQVKITLGTANN